MDDLDKLRAITEAATPGPWQTSYLDEGIAEIETVDGGHVAVGDGAPHDATFIATFDPPTVAALIDRVERAERQRDKYRKHAETCQFGIELGDLRDGIRQLADEWAPPGKDSYGVIESDNAADALRALLTEGAETNG